MLRGPTTLIVEPTASCYFFSSPCVFLSSRKHTCQMAPVMRKQMLFAFSHMEVQEYVIQAQH